MSEMAVERETRAKLSRRIVQYTLRGLVVAGVAGAAWLFWSSSAQAAPSAPAAEGTGPAGSVLELGGAFLDPLAAPASPLTRPLTQPVTRLVEAAKPLLAAVSEPAARGTSPAFAPVLSAVKHAQPTTVSRSRPFKVSRLSKLDEAGADAGVTVTNPTAAVPAAEVVPVQQKSTNLFRRAAASRPASPVGDRAGPDGAPLQSPPALPERPLGPLPAFPVPGTGLIGASPMTPGSTSDGGATAVLPYRFAAGTVARHRTVPAADVAARPLTALVPTVSPD